MKIYFFCFECVFFCVYCFVFRTRNFSSCNQDWVCVVAFLFGFVCVVLCCCRLLMAPITFLSQLCQVFSTDVFTDSASKDGGAFVCFYFGSGW